jgi:hypothetical protein
MGRNQYSGLTLIERFLEKIKINPVTACWEWQGSSNKKMPYGRIAVGRKGLLTHRLSYTIYIGELEDHMNVLHKCDNASCCSPFHIFKGTQAENMNDAQSKGRRPVTSCPSHMMYKKGCRCDGCIQLYRECSRIKSSKWRLNNPEKYKEKSLLSDEKRKTNPKRIEYNRLRSIRQKEERIAKKLADKYRL